MHTANPIQALEAAGRALNLARTAADPATLGSALTAYACALVSLRRDDDAQAVLEEAARIAPKRNVLLHERIIDTRAMLAALVGDLDTAALFYEQFLRANMLRGDVRRANSCAANLAEIEHLRGKTEHAVSILREVLPVLRAGADRGMLLTVLANLSGYLVALNRLAEARDTARENFRTSKESDRDGVAVVFALEHAALILGLEGDIERGAQLAGWTDATLKRRGLAREFTEQTTRRRLDATLDERLTPAELSVLLARGADLSPDEAIGLTDARQSRSGREAGADGATRRIFERS